MGIYAVTGSASGIGAAIAAKLVSQGHRVIGIDLRDADIVANLANDAGRQAAIAGVLAAAPNGLDGFVASAGLGPHVEPIALIPQVNFFGAVALTTALKPSLARRRGSVVLVCSTSAVLGEFDAAYLKAMADGDEAAAIRIVTALNAGATAYGGSKYALGCWMRSCNLEYARDGIRMNAIAPGFTETPMARAIVKDATHGAATQGYADCTPLGRYGTSEDQAEATAFLLSPQASFISGTVLFVDGGSDAMLRPDRF